MGGLFHFEERKNIFIPSKKSKLLEMMKPEQKSRVDLEQISLGCDGPGLIDPRVYHGEVVRDSEGDRQHRWVIPARGRGGFEVFLIVSEICATGTPA